MNALLRSFWVLVHLMVTVPVLWVFLQTLFARLPKLKDEPTPQDAPARGPLVVLIPAHNEGRGLLPTLASIQPQLLLGDRLLVVADNCQDDTALVARAAGAEVIERQNPTQRGKGWALDFGVRHLAAPGAKAAPDYVLIVDADCVVAPGSVARVVARCAATQGPVQAMTLMAAPAGAGMQQRFAEFAWRMKNKARPLGGLALGAPCQLTGTGMVFPWSVIQHAPLASSNIVEDMQMGVDLALRGQLPCFEPHALLTSSFPASSDGAQAQRARWEHGHMATLLHAGPRLIGAGLARFKPALVVMGIDLMVPPLALLLMSMLALGALDMLVAWLFGWAFPLAWMTLLVGAFAAAIAITWIRFGEGTVTGRELGLAPFYALRKIPLYIGFVFKRQTEWVRAKRDGE